MKTAEILQIPGKTPTLYFEVEPTLKTESPPTLFFYGHFDKQPPFEGWREGFGPTTPVIEDGKLYG